MTYILLALTVALAAIPIVWIFRNSGARRDRASERGPDGLVMLLSLVFCAFALWVVGVAGMRLRQESEVARSWTPVVGVIEDCSVSEVNGGTRDRSRCYRLDCSVVVGKERTKLTAGYPRHEEPVAAWVRAHPAGSSVALYRNPRDPSELWGLGRDAGLVTDDSRDAARRAFTFALASFVLFLAARAIVARRKRGRRI